MSAIEIHGISHGIRLESEDFLTEAHILQGNGHPGGDGDVQDEATIGSIYMQTDAQADNLQFYWKYRTTQNSAEDWQQVVSKEFLNSIISGISWREPALVLDPTTYADITAAETAANVADTINGQVISAGDSILLTDLTTGNENAYIVSGSSGAWTLTESANTASDGDTILIQEGAAAEQQWTYNGTGWVHTGGAASASELANLRNFVGKNAVGVESPAYTSTNTVTPGVSLEAAIGELDAASGSGLFTEDNFVVDGDSTTDNIDKLDIQLGDGTHSSTNLISDANDITENLSALDGAVGTRDYTNTANHLLNTDSESVTDSLEKLNVGVGTRNYTNGHNLTNGDTITKSLDDLDSAIGDPNHTSTNTISNAADINTNLSSIDAAIGSQTFSNDNVVTDGETVTASLDAIDSQLGNNTFTDGNVVNNGNNISQNMDALDVALGNIDDQTKVIKTANVSAQTAIDTIPVAEAEVAKWIVSWENTADATNRQSLEVHAIHNGTNAKFDRYSVRRFGPKFTGLDLDVDINAGSLRLLLSSPTGVDVAVKRVGYYTIN